MEKLIILLLVAVGSAISHYYQNKKKREEEEEKLGGGPMPPSRGEPPLVPPWPKSGKDWQEELRRMLGGEMAPPPVPPRPPAPPFPTPRTVIRTKVVPPRSETPPARERSEGDFNFPSPLRQSATAYARAAQLPEKVETRLQAIDARTKAHHPSQVTGRRLSPNAAVMRRWIRDRNSLREAFLASLIFAPPVGLTGQSESRGG